MAKNLKLNIKNTQLAQALNIGKVKSKAPRKTPALKEEAAAIEGEEPRKVIKARSKSSPPPVREVVEEAAPAAEPQAGPLGPTAEEAKDLQAIEAERQRKIQNFLKGDEEETPPQKPTLQVEPAPPKEPPAPPKKAYTPPPRRESPHYQERKFAPRQGFTPRPQGGGAPYKQRPTWTPQGPKRFETPPQSTTGTGPRLGPTGRHVKDLYRPAPPQRREEGRRDFSRPALGSRPGGMRGGRPFTPPPPPPKEERPTRDSLAKHFKKTEETEAPTARKPREFQDLKPLKKQSMRSFDARDRQGLTASDDEQWRKRRPSKGAKAPREEDTTIRPTSLKIRLPITIKDLAAEMKVKAAQLISTLFMQGVIVTLNDFLDDETTVQLLGHECGCEITVDTSEEERIRVTGRTIAEEIRESNPDESLIRAPVVTFMGHVDHGKTSLIDAIRKSNRVAAEAGAITQHIGAFRCKTAVGEITILDTPGHEAFSAMRSRGASVTDIVVLVIAGDEGMKQQTIEAMNQAKEAKVTIVVALNKCDKPGFNQDMVYQQLATHELLPEAWGGTTITVNCSAMTGEGVDHLLEMLALQAEVLELKANPSMRARGTVLESSMHKGLGAMATVLVQNGTLHEGDALVFDQFWGRVKTMHDEHEKLLKEAGPSTPVAITGLSGLPEAGSEFIAVKNEKEAREIAEARVVGARQTSLAQKKKLSVESLVQQAAGVQKKVANFIIRADVQGSLEALKLALLGIKSSKIDLQIVSFGVGEISESDVELAAASSAIIIGFHTQIESHAESIIKQLGVRVVLFDVIYHAVEEVRKILLDLLDKIPEERELGQADVIALFKASQLGTIAGCKVAEGTIVRGQKARLVRDDTVIWSGSISSLKRLKEDVKEVRSGLECGIVLDGSTPQVGDKIQCYEIHYLTQEL